MLFCALKTHAHKQFGNTPKTHLCLGQCHIGVLGKAMGCLAVRHREIENLRALSLRRELVLDERRVGRLAFTDLNGNLSVSKATKTAQWSSRKLTCSEFERL